jgi:predicted dehydrogenase
MSQNSNKTNRRTFLSKTGMVAAGLTLGANQVSAKSYSRILGANDKIRVGFIGVGNRGSQVMHEFMNEPDCEVAALCDVYEPYITRDRSKVDPRYIETRPVQIPKMGENFSNQVGRYKDYRKLLEDKSIDAVYIGTPDHWHPLQAIDSMSAGKDIFVEKPLTKSIHEGRAIIKAWEKSNQVAGVCLNRRGSGTYQKLAREVPAGKIGKVTFAMSNHVSNMYPNGIGKMNPERPPKDFDWDMWLGPKPYRPYQYNIAPYMFRWWEEYDNQILNNGVHSLDLIRWLLNEKAPVSVTTLGGKYAIDDDRTIPDTMQSIFEFPSGVMATFTQLEASSGSLLNEGFLELRGTDGTLYIAGNNGFRIAPTSKGQFQTWDKLMDAETYEVPGAGDGKLIDGTYANPGANLVRNFLNCVKSREMPMVSLEEAHLSTNMAHLATISLHVKQTLHWDAEKEIVTNCEEANKLLSYEYREPWKLNV